MVWKIFQYVEMQGGLRLNIKEARQKAGMTQREQTTIRLPDEMKLF